jgi:hypothetical protein
MWSKKYDKCVVCGTTEKKHYGKGRCVNCYSKKRYKENPKRHSKIVKKWQEKNIEKHKESCRKWQKENPEKMNEFSKNYRKENPKKIKAYNKKYYSENSEKENMRCKKYRELNPEKVREIARRDHLNRRHNDFRYKLRCNISSLISGRLKKRLSSKKSKSTFDFLPYTIEDLVQHLEKQFKKGMTWNNYGINGWHVDHIHPDCKFNYKNVEDKEFQKCWALKNLQPLWARDNWEKNRFY